ncbi:YcaO-like family protein [Desulfohalobiaceae bacterium Ax17]|uniref:YcaO-like family protein n=1 Tax=Desulfovulcanus ferrireducens TaxID=2831190 RepID=UPI00207BABBA|nr:YcaO-like family protein [Desulfovulcanus ferrireducens]MBT8762653.1 YcaO-like family protein [Desulfovulcanus ferrireducens]
MNTKIILKPCPKGYSKDLDKATPPEHTVAKVKEVLANWGQEILAELKRIDTGRLGIPVYMSICGPKARGVMPTRKQMGKGASPAQAQASALMELVERFSFFNFVQDEKRFRFLTWSEAEKSLGSKLLPVQEILHSVQEQMPPSNARQILDLVQWKFTSATEIDTEKECYLPFDWFKKLNEFNGSSAGNTAEESILQGACELIERHTCAIIDEQRLIRPTIDPDTFSDPILKELYLKFKKQGIKVWLKDFSLDMPAPTVGAVAYDPKTFPASSEIVFTAGTATSPHKAAIRALTEIAQLAGDFESGSNYEASGLSKFTSLDQIHWLTQGEKIALDKLPSLEDDDIYLELKKLCNRLASLGFRLYSISTSHPELGIATHYNIIPGFRFRERTKNASLGLFVGRIIAEEEEPQLALKKLDTLAEIYPQSYFIPFFKGLAFLRLNKLELAADHFAKSEPLQPDNEEKGLAAFYYAYTLTQAGRWSEALPHLDRAIALSPDVKEYYNLRGVALFKQKEFEQAAKNFQEALNLDQGSAVDLANLGLCYKFLGQKEKAIELLSEALKLEPNLDFANKQLNELLDLS